MGCGGSKADEVGAESATGASGSSDADAASRALEKELEEQNRAENAIVKLLVLGTGESGKSTVFKQMKILYAVPDPPHKFIMICRANLFQNAIAVMDGMKRLNIKFSSSDAEGAGELIKAVPQDGNPANIKELIKPLETLYADAGIKEAIERAAEYQLNDSTIYFWDRAEVLCQEDYVPTEQDVLRSRVRTTGIVQQNFQIKDKKYPMFDVGGQRNERRKWIHCFDNVTAVIFVTAISEYDQVLYEDENTNRMDEALLLFDQICNHASFQKTSMILFLNKRDLFETKLKKPVMLTKWKPDDSEIKALWHDGSGYNYDEVVKYLKEKFISKNKDPENRQVYVHATCATDTKNIEFVMGSVFDIILKDNLRKLAVGNVDELLELAVGTGSSQMKTDGVWSLSKTGKVILAACYFTEELGTKKVLQVKAGELPAVQIAEGDKISGSDWAWVMGLGKELPDLEVFDSEDGTFKGDFKRGAKTLKTNLGAGLSGESLGAIYDNSIELTLPGKSMIKMVVAVKRLKTEVSFGEGFEWVVHDDFEKANISQYAGATFEADKGGEFNPFAPNPVGPRWFKGVRLFTKEVGKIPDKGVYLGIFKVLSSTDGFKVMVNEHNRIGIPMIFLTESQLDANDEFWMKGVRCREEQFQIDLLEGKQPNRGWLGPEMSGEEGATFPEKLWWAIDEAKARLDTEDIGKQYDTELLFIDEQDNIQLLLYGVLAGDSTDCLPGHIWVDKTTFLRENMKYLCPKVLQGLIAEQQKLIEGVQMLNSAASTDMAEANANRQKKDKQKEQLRKVLSSQTPLKWVDRVIMWCANKMPSFCDGVPGGEAKEVVKNAIAKASNEVDKTTKDRQGLIKKYS